MKHRGQDHCSQNSDVSGTTSLNGIVKYMYTLCSIPTLKMVTNFPLIRIDDVSIVSVWLSLIYSKRIVFLQAM